MLNTIQNEVLVIKLLRTDHPSVLLLQTTKGATDPIRISNPMIASTRIQTLVVTRRLHILAVNNYAIMRKHFTMKLRKPRRANTRLKRHTAKLREPGIQLTRLQIQILIVPLGT